MFKLQCAELSHITKISLVTMLLTAGLKIFNAQFMYVCMICLQFHMPDSSGSLVIAIKCMQLSFYLKHTCAHTHAYMQAQAHMHKVSEQEFHIFPRSVSLDQQQYIGIDNPKFKKDSTISQNKRSVQMSQ
jgi:hypothetical protein